MNLTTSVVISTYNRPDGVLQLLRSLAKQTVLPEVIIVVDQSKKDEIKKAIEKAQSEAVNSGKPLPPIDHCAVTFQGLTPSRNYGLARVKTHYTTFLDDDVTVGPRYLEEALAFFKTHETTVLGGIPQFPGIVDRKGPPIPSKKWQLYRKFFHLTRPSDSCKLLDNFEIEYCVDLKEPVQTDFISGSNFTVITNLAKEVGFDEKLIWYSIGEDLDFPLRMRMLRPNSVWQDPRLEVYHPLAAEKPMTEFLTFVHTVHKYYLFYKMWNGNPPLKARYEFFMSRVGEIMLPSLLSRKHKVLPNDKLLKESLKVELKILSHLENVKKGIFPT